MYARYTVVLKDLMDNEQTRQELSSKLSTYPLYQPKTKVDNIPDRETINKRLLNEYKYREIGLPTVGRFLDELEIAMCEIMPFYNELFKTVETMANLENPFDNVDFTESYKETRSGSANTESSETASDEGSTNAENESTDTTSSTGKTTTTKNSQNDSKEVNSATPQDSLGIVASDIDSIRYADNANWKKAHNTENESTDTESAGTTNSNSNQSATTKNSSERAASGSQTTQGSVEHTFTKKGNQGVNTYAHDMNEFRTSIIDVTNQIINDERISSLFMRVF